MVARIASYCLFHSLQARALQQLRHPHLATVVGTIGAGGAGGVLLEAPVHMLDTALCSGQLTRQQQLTVCYQVALALEFLGSRRVFLSHLQLNDVGLTSSFEAKLCKVYGQVTTPVDGQPREVLSETSGGPQCCAAFGDFLQAVMKGSGELSTDPAVANVRDKCWNGQLSTLCDLVLAANAVSRRAMSFYLIWDCISLYSCVSFSVAARCRR